MDNKRGLSHRLRHLHAAAASGAFLLQRHCAEGGVLAADTRKTDREESDHDSRIGFKMGDDDECLPALSSQRVEKVGI